MATSQNSKSERFSQLLFILLIYTIIVILWGAWVRISHSGDGCGDTWPLCHGQIIPEAQQGKTWVELSHRMMSGLFGLLIIGLYLRVRKNFTKIHPIRLWALLSLIFTISEALLGAKLVLFKLVSSNDSPYRAFIMSLHLINSLMLTGSIAMTWEFSKSNSWLKRSSSPWTFEGLKVRKVMFATLFIFLLIAVTGALAALSNTLFPSLNLSEGFLADWDPNSHFLIRLRALHPMSGIVFGGSLALISYLSVQLLKADEAMVRRRSYFLAGITAGAVVFGVLTLLSLAPIWMKLTHLFIAHSVWLSLVLWLTSLRYSSHRS